MITKRSEVVSQIQGYLDNGENMTAIQVWSFLLWATLNTDYDANLWGKSLEKYGRH